MKAYEKPPMMGCGHAANAADAEKRPVCAICVGIHPGHNVVATTPDLTGRTAYCAYYGGKCQSKTPSDTSLAFFEMGNRRMAATDPKADTYYCGCYGWD